MESKPQNPEFRNNPETFTHENFVCFLRLLHIYSNAKKLCSEEEKRKKEEKG